MSLRDALHFITLVREDPALADEIRALGVVPDLEGVVAAGARRGLVFTVEEIRAAHRHDAAMRVIRYTGPTPST